MNQLKFICNSPFKSSHSHPIHTCLATIASNGCALPSSAEKSRTQGPHTNTHTQIFLMMKPKYSNIFLVSRRATQVDYGPRINEWAYLGRFFWALFMVQKGHHTEMCTPRVTYVWFYTSSGGSKGGGGESRTPPPPPRPSKFFQFHAVFGRIWQNCVFTPPTWRVHAHTEGKSWIRHWLRNICIRFRVWKWRRRNASSRCWPLQWDYHRLSFWVERQESKTQELHEHPSQTYVHPPHRHAAMLHILRVCCQDEKHPELPHEQRWVHTKVFPK